MAFEDVGLRAQILGLEPYLTGLQRMNTGGQQLSTGLTNLSRNTQASSGVIGAATGQIGKQLGFLVSAIAASVGAFATFRGIQSAISYTDDLAQSVKRLTTQTGLTSEAASHLIFAFQHFGLGADAASSSLRIFEKNLKGIQDAETGVLEGGKRATAILADMGIHALDATDHIRPMDQLLAEVADHFHGMTNAVDMTGLAIQLFGRSGASLVPLLQQGSEGLRALGAEADKLGVTLSADNVAKIQAYTFAHRDLGEAMGGLKLQIGEALMPALTRLIRLFVDNAPAIRGFVAAFIEAVSALVHYIASIVTSGNTLNAWLFQLPSIVRPTALAIGILVKQLIELIRYFKENKSAAQVLGIAMAALLTVFAVNEVLGFALALERTALAMASLGRKSVV